MKNKNNDDIKIEKDNEKRMLMNKKNKQNKR